MDLKAYEKRRVRDLYRRNIKNLSSRRRYAEFNGRSFTPDQKSIRKRFYCYYLLDTLDLYYLRDLAFLRDPTCDAGVDEYDTYREAKKQIDWA